jgi:hypothetical protein
MEIRRVVTGHDAAGNAVFVADEAIVPKQLALFPGMETYELWSTEGPRAVPREGPLPRVPRDFPGEDGSVFPHLRLPPAPEPRGLPAGPELAAGLGEMQAKLPDLPEHLVGARPR